MPAVIFVFFRQFLKLLATSNTRISVNNARKIKCYISESKLILCEYNAFYFSEIAFIGFTLHEIKQGIVFLGTPGSICLFNFPSKGIPRSNNSKKIRVIEIVRPTFKFYKVVRIMRYLIK